MLSMLESTLLLSYKLKFAIPALLLLASCAKQNVDYAKYVNTCIYRFVVLQKSKGKSLQHHSQRLPLPVFGTDLECYQN